MSKRRKYLIIGNSAAAIGCIEGIRKIDQEGAITLVSSEPYHTYSRPLISYLLCGKADRDKMKYRSDSFYDDNGVFPILGKSAVKIDPEHKQVTLSDGMNLMYDKLLVATGSKPFVPPMKGLADIKKKFSFQSLDDALAIDAAITPESRVLIVGAGLIGLKCAEGIADKVQSVQIVDLADHILPSILDEEGAAMVQHHIEQKNITFYLSDSVSEFREGLALLQSGKELPFDILVIAVGVRPNTELVSEAGGQVNRGIVTNIYTQTTLPDIYAAGDCAESHDITTDSDRVLALLPNAYMQGEAAGINMASNGKAKAYDIAMPMNAMGMFGLHLITAGNYTGEAEICSEPGCYKKFFVRDGLLNGYILIGDVRRAGIYTALIRDRTPLASIDFALIKEHPQLMAFQKSDRAKKLAGAR